MDREMININANLVKEAEFSEFEKDGYPPATIGIIVSFILILIIMESGSGTLMEIQKM